MVLPPPPRPTIGETISGQFWTNVAGSSSLHAAATNLTNVAQQVQAVLMGHQVNSGVMQAAWQGPTGVLANAADTPHQAWLQATVAQLEGAAASTQGLATAFDTAQMATPHPGAFAINDMLYPFWWYLSQLSLGIFSAPLHANNAEHAGMTTAATTAQGTYTATSAVILGAMEAAQGLTPPPVSGTPAGGVMSGSITGGMAGQPFGSLLQSAAGGLGASPGSAASAAMPAINAATQPLSSVSSLVSQPTNALASPGQLASTAGPLASSPAQAAQGFGGVPSGMPPVGSQGPGAGGPGTNDGTWYGAGTATGGTVAAALTPGGGVGGGVGMGGLGMAMRPALSGPVSWASTAAAPEANQITLSRFDQTRAAMAGSPTSANMGAPGTMMPPAGRQGSASERDRALDTALATAAALYRPPRNMPVVTGAAGMHYLAGEEDQ